MTPEQLVADVSPRIRDVGWAFYFAPSTVARAQELGLDALSFYLLGRGGVLGDVEAPVVASAFGYFNPTLIQTMWDASREVLEPRQAGRAYVAAAADFGRATFADIEDLDAFCAAADAVNDAADPVGLSLYAAARCEPLASDSPARAMQLLALLREFRGSAHLVAIRASGLDALTAHCVKRPDDLSMFGWSDDDAVAVTDAHREAWAAAEALTDVMVRPAYAVLDAAGQEALVTGLDRVETALVG